MKIGTAIANPSAITNDTFRHKLRNNIEHNNRRINQKPQQLPLFIIVQQNEAV